MGLETVEKYTVGHSTSWQFYFDLFVTKMYLFIIRGKLNVLSIP